MCADISESVRFAVVVETFALLDVKRLPTRRAGTLLFDAMVIAPNFGLTIDIVCYLLHLFALLYGGRNVE